MRGRAERLTWRHGWRCRGRLPGAGWRPGTMGRQCPPFPSKTAPGSGSAAAFQLAWWDEHQLRGRHIMCQSYCAMLDISMPTYVEIVLFLSLSLSSVYLECLFISVGKKKTYPSNKTQWDLQKYCLGKQTHSSKEDTATHKCQGKTPMKWITSSQSLGKTLPSHIAQCLGTTPCQAGWLHWLRALLGVKVHSQDKSSLTLIHVPGEAGQDTTQRCCIKKVHGAAEEAEEQLVVERGGSLHRALSTQTRAAFEHETWHI